MIKIKRNVLEQIQQIAREELPNEACGYLAGKDNKITHCYRLTNIDHSPKHFAFDPKEQFETMINARNKGLEIIANFHSHPETPARPSEEDIRLAFDPQILYGIISLAEPAEILKFFKIESGKVTSVGYTLI